MGEREGMRAKKSGGIALFEYSKKKFHGKRGYDLQYECATDQPGSEQHP